MDRAAFRCGAEAVLQPLTGRQAAVTRRDFIGNAFAAVGFLALPGGFLFAAPKGWKHGGMPNLVLGVVSDTHLRTAHKGNGIGSRWTDKYFVAALEYFKACNVDAVVHCGDMAHSGQTRELEFHAKVWHRIFDDGHEPVKLFVVGNHDVEGSGYGGFVTKRYPDPVERAKHVFATDMAANWERVWGEKYEPVWHREVKGYHFFGRQWGVAEGELAKALEAGQEQYRLVEGVRPFFLLSHARPHSALNKKVARLRNAVSFFGHWHHSAANWNEIYMWGGPTIQCPSCEPRGLRGLCGDGYIAHATLEGADGAGLARQGYVVRVYDDMLTIERREFGEGGSLGADWVMPFEREEGKGKREEERIKKPHPFSKEELKKVIGEPQFRKGAKLEVVKDSASPRLRVRIPLADGNPDSRVYAYEVVVVGEAGSKKLFKAVYAAGCNMGIGHEPNNGVTTLEIPKSELPPGKTLTVAARPLTSLGTYGRPISVEVHT